MGMKEPPARKGNAHSKGKRETDTTEPKLEDFKRSHPQRGATGAVQQPKIVAGRKEGGNAQK